jgi:hypothetical protein
MLWPRIVRVRSSPAEVAPALVARRRRLHRSLGGRLYWRQILLGNAETVPAGFAPIVRGSERLHLLSLRLLGFPRALRQPPRRGLVRIRGLLVGERYLQRNARLV